ncbi:hypothetical protein ACFWY9_01380, partial [Amycolatopsis sp. NPDC059027]
IRQFFDRVNDILSWVPDILSHMIEPIKQQIDAVDKRYLEFQNKVNEFWHNKGNTDKLRLFATQWAEKVGNPYGEAAGNVALEKLQTNTEWHGRAAETYKTTVPAQVNGLNAMKDIGLQIRNSLTDLANGIDSFWVTVNGILIGLAIGIGATIASALTVVGLPAAVALILTTIGAGVAGIFQAIGAVQTLTNLITTQQMAIDDKVRNLGKNWAMTQFDKMTHPGDWRTG